MRQLITWACAVLLLTLPGLTAQSQDPNQEKTITGTVNDAGGLPIPGVNVLIKGTERGVLTDSDGRFSLQVATGETLVFSFVGMESVEQTVDERNTYQVVLQEDRAQLDEVVVIGYGTQRREDVTSAVASIGSEDFIKSSAKDAASLIKGKVAGLVVNEPSGNPTESSEISLRGTTTLRASTNPLVLVDGVPGELNSVAPEQIERIDVLKDGSAAAIYGSRGSNGVILITTKKGRGEARIQYQGYTNIQTIANQLDFLDANDHRRLIAEGVNFIDYGGNTDWLDEITRTPVSHSHQLTFTGGTEQTNYTASINYRNLQGLFLRSDNEDIVANADIRHSMFDNKLQVDLNIVYHPQNFYSGDAPRGREGFYEWIHRMAIQRHPTEPIYDENGNWQERDILRYENPLAWIWESNGLSERKRQRINGSVTWRPLENLSLKLLGSSRSENFQYGYAETKRHVSTTKNNINGYAKKEYSSEKDRLMELTGTYQNTAGAHEFNILGGYSYQEVISEGSSMENFDFPTDSYSYNFMQGGDALPEGRAGMSSFRESYRLISFFSRLNYNFDNRYLLMGSVRYEGNSKFGTNHKWGWFPAVSAGWRISEEAFLENSATISDLKLRVGFGVTGIAPSTPYQSLISYAYGDRVFNNGQWVQGISPARNSNPDLRWERKEEINAGLDFSLLGDRIIGSIDIYRRNTKDMLWDYSVPVPPFLYGSILANVGQIRNEGIELVLNYNAIDSREFSWNTGLAYSTNKNELVSLSNEIYQTENDYFDVGDTGPPISYPTHRVQVGGPVGDFYGYESVDIDEDGKWIVLNQNGERISIDEASPDDRRIIGNGIPKHNLAWNNSLRYRNFDLNINMRGAFGFDILNGSRMYYENPSVIQYNLLKSAFDNVYGKRQLTSSMDYVSYYLENGNYWKIDNVTLGYNFNPGQGVVKNARVYVSGRNLVTITSYKGVDPEVITTGLTPGYEVEGRYPLTRTLTLGLNLTF